jgi:predicted RNA binding protein YcfA (HicA-like mRNA interferase family)
MGLLSIAKRGSHIIVRREDLYARVVVPAQKQLRPGTLGQILSEAGLSVEQLLERR